MGAAKQRKLDARVRRQESLHNQGKPNVNENIVKDSKQEKKEVKKEVKKEIVNEVKNKKVVKVEVEVKRGRGRPPKSVATTKKAPGSVKKPTISKKGKK